MAFPVVEAVASNVDTSGARIASLPADIATGDRLIVGVAHVDTANVPNTPDGWTQLAQSGMSSDGYVVWTKVAAGDEGTSLTVSFPSGDEEIATFSYRISGAGAVYVSTPSQGGSGTQPDAPEFTPPDGADDILWIECVFCGSALHNGSIPTDYTAGPRADSAGTACSARSSYRFLNATAENPGADNCNSSTHGWDALVIAVYPPAGATVVTPAALAPTLSVLSASPAGTATTVPSNIDLNPVLPQVTPVGPATVTPAVLAATANLLSVTPVGSVVVAPANLEVALSLLAATPVPGGSTVTPDTIRAGLLLLGVTPVGPAIVAPSETPLSVTIPGPSAGSDVIVTVSEIATAVAFGQAVVVAAGIVTADDLGLAVVLYTPSAFQPAVHPPGPATAVLDATGATAAPSASSILAAVLTYTGTSSAAPNTGRSAAAGGTSGSEAE